MAPREGTGTVRTSPFQISGSAVQELVEHKQGEGKGEDEKGTRKRVMEKATGNWKEGKENSEL